MGPFTPRKLKLGLLIWIKYWASQRCWSLITDQSNQLISKFLSFFVWYCTPNSLLISPQPFWSPSWFYSRFYSFNCPHVEYFIKFLIKVIRSQVHALTENLLLSWFEPWTAEVRALSNTAHLGLLLLLWFYVGGNLHRFIVQFLKIIYVHLLWFFSENLINLPNNR